jgi:hypothetical protein
MVKYVDTSLLRTKLLAISPLGLLGGLVTSLLKAVHMPVASSREMKTSRAESRNPLGR